MFRPRRVVVANGKYVKVGEKVMRPSPLGNPFRLHHEHMRDEVCDKYEAWLDRKIAERDPDVCAELNRIYRLARRRKLNLLCVCAPQRCHAEYIALVLNKTLGERMQQGLVLSDSRLAELLEEATTYINEAEGMNCADYEELVDARYEKLCIEEERKLKSVSKQGAS